MIPRVSDMGKNRNANCRIIVGSALDGRATQLR